MARYRILSSKGIPAQVKAGNELGQRVSGVVPDWFTQEIDRVAMRDRIIGTDAYLEAWTWSAETEAPGTAAAVADASVADEVARWGDRG